MTTALHYAQAEQFVRSLCSRDPELEPELTAARGVDAIADEPASEGPRRLAPLPLPVVLANVAKLHAQCSTGDHRCGLPPQRLRFDLYRDYLVPARRYRAAV